jgi:hypothetical protein
MDTVNCLDHASRHDAAAIFRSTSGIYPATRLRELPLVPQKLALSSQSYKAGVFGPRHSEKFVLTGRRSLYGATKCFARSDLTSFERGDTFWRNLVRKFMTCFMLTTFVSYLRLLISELLDDIFEWLRGYRGDPEAILK